MKENQILHLVRILEMKKEQTPQSIKPFTLTEDEQRYCNSQIKSVGPSFANENIITRAYDYFAEDDIDPIGKEVCRTYVSIFRRHKFIYFVSFHALLEHDFADAHESDQILNLNDVHIHMPREQLTILDCMTNIKLQPIFLKRKVGKIQLNGPG